MYIFIHVGIHVCVFWTCFSESCTNCLDTCLEGIGATQSQAKVCWRPVSSQCKEWLEVLKRFDTNKENLWTLNKLREWGFGGHRSTNRSVMKRDTFCVGCGSQVSRKSMFWWKPVYDLNWHMAAAWQHAIQTSHTPRDSCSNQRRTLHCWDDHIISLFEVSGNCDISNICVQEPRVPCSYLRPSWLRFWVVQPSRTV